MRAPRLIAALTTALAGTAAETTPPSGLLTIPEIERLVLAQDPVVAAARAGVEAARGQERIAAQVPNPTFTAGAEQFPIPHPGTNLTSTRDGAAQHTYTLRVDQEIELGRKRGLRIGQSEWQISSASAQVDDTIRQRLALARQDAIAYLLAQVDARIAQEDLQTVDSEEAALSRQVAAGNLPENDLAKFQVARADVEKTAAAASLAGDQSLADLRSLVGEDAGGPAFSGVAGDLDTDPPDSPDARDLERVIAARPDSRAAAAAVEAARRGLGLAHAQRWVDPTVGVEYQRIGSDDTVGMVVSVPLPLWNNHQGDIDVAVAQLRQATLQYDAVLRSARADASKSNAALASARHVRALYSSGVIDKARISLQRIESSYEAGGASSTDLAEARRAYSQVRFAAEQAAADAWNAYYQLEAALGRMPDTPSAAPRTP
jgi:cobalt-zinc-cadmium efflux system outer membrane protein